MKDRQINISIFVLIIIVAISTLIGRKDVYFTNVSNNVLKTGNVLVEKKDIEDPILDLSSMGYKKASIYIDNNTISFDNSNVYTDLDISLVNKILLSDKSNWNLITNNLVDDYTYDNNMITINDNNITSISFSFIYNDIEYHLALVNDNNVYFLRNADIKVIHGNINSLWYQYVYDIDTAIKACKNGDYIVLYSDLNIDHTLNINKSITIMSNEGNTYTITNDNGFLFNISNKVELNIKDILINTDSFVKGKGSNKVLLENTRVIYKNLVVPKKSNLKNNIYSDDLNTFIKEAI